MKTKATVSALLLFVAAVMMSGSAMAATSDASESSTVNVTVASTIALDVKPDSLVYSNAEVGSQNQSSDGNFQAIDIENTGSEYIDQIWLNTTAPDTDPFGSGSASNYDAGNFIQVKVPSGQDVGGLITESNWHFVNRKEYTMTKNDSTNLDSTTYVEQDIPSYLEVPVDVQYANPNGTTFSATQIEVGAIDVGSEQFYFVIPHTQSGTCDGGGNAFVRVANVSQTDARLGTNDFSPDASNPNYRDYDLETVTGSNYGITEAAGSGGVSLNMSDGTNRKYDMMVNCDETTHKPNSYVLNYNVNALGANDVSGSSGAGTANDFVLDTSSASEMLYPGDAVTLETAIMVPAGVVEGSVGQGKLRVFVGADTTAN